MATLDELAAKYLPPAIGLGAPHQADTRITTYVDGAACLGRIADLLDTLRGPGDRVYLTSWQLDTSLKLRPVPGEPDLTDRLLTLAAAGADVRLVVAVPRYALGRQGAPFTDPDHWRGWAFSQGIGRTATLNITSVRALRSTPRNGPPPLADRVLVDWGGGFDSRHEKCTIVYSAETAELHAFVGGIDYDPERFSAVGHAGAPAGNYWHDAAVHLVGGAATSALDNFWTRWDETVDLPPRRYWFAGAAEQFNPTIAAAPALRNPAAPMPAGPLPPDSYDDAGLRIWRSYGPRKVTGLADGNQRPWLTLPATGVQEVTKGLTNAIEAATRYVYVEDQTINSSRLSRFYDHHDVLYPILSDACARGVKVVFVTQGFAGVNSDFDANLSFSPEIEDLILSPLSVAQQDNFALFYVRDVKVHAKLVLVDDEFVSVGSANMWDRSQVGDESELNVAAVHPGESGSLVGDLRVRLWREHFRMPADPGVTAALRNLNASLGCFRDSWGTGLVRPNSALVEVTR